MIIDTLDVFADAHRWKDCNIKKRASELQRAATTSLPLLRSRPGGLGGSWPCRTYPAAKVLLFPKLARIFRENIQPRPLTGWGCVVWVVKCFWVNREPMILNHHWERGGRGGSRTGSAASLGR